MILVTRVGVAVVAASVVMAATAGTLALASRAHRVPTTERGMLSEPNRVAISAVDAPARAVFSVLGSDPEAMPESVTRWVMEDDFYAKFGLNVQLAQGVLTAASSQPVWILPGNGYICLWMADPIDAGGLVCDTTENAIAGRLVFTQFRPGDTTSHVVALVPNGVTSASATSDSGTHPISLESNLASVTGSDVSRVSYEDGGREVLIDTPTPPR